MSLARRDLSGRRPDTFDRIAACRRMNSNPAPVAGSSCQRLWARPIATPELRRPVWPSIPPSPVEVIRRWRLRRRTCSWSTHMPPNTQGSHRLSRSNPSQSTRSFCTVSLRPASRPSTPFGSADGPCAPGAAPSTSRTNGSSRPTWLVRSPSPKWQARRLWRPEPSSRRSSSMGSGNACPGAMASSWPSGTTCTSDQTSQTSSVFPSRVRASRVSGRGHGCGDIRVHHPSVFV